MGQNIDKMKDLFKSGKDKQTDKKGKKKKGRPSMLKEEDKKGVPKPIKFSSNPEYRSIENWNYKLENMLTILQAGEDSSKLIPSNLIILYRGRHATGWVLKSIQVDSHQLAQNVGVDRGATGLFQEKWRTE